MIHIDRNGFVPTQAWLQKAKDLTLQLLLANSKQEINNIIDNNDVWRELKDALLNLDKYCGKCWYSESKNDYSYMHVDHFRPKKAAIGLDKQDYGGYWWLAFNWQNYRVCGGVGNINKKDKFAVFRNKANSPKDNIDDEIIYLLDPTEEEDTLKVTFNSNGEIMSLYQDGFYLKQVEYTISCLKLNYKPLKESRKEIWIKCERLIADTQTLIQNNNQTPSSYRRGLIKEKIKQIKDLVKSTAEYSATAKACLKSTGIDWIVAIAA